MTAVLVEVTITTNGLRDASVELANWLMAEPDLRGRVRQRVPPPEPGEQGALTELIVGLSGTGAATALATAVQVWLSQRKKSVKVKVVTAQGRTVEMKAEHVDSVSEVTDLLMTALNEHTENSEPAPLELDVSKGENGDGEARGQDGASRSTNRATTPKQ